MGEMKIFRHTHKLENFKPTLISHQVSKKKLKSYNMLLIIYKAHTFLTVMSIFTFYSFLLHTNHSRIFLEADYCFQIKDKKTGTEDY